MLVADGQCRVLDFVQAGLRNSRARSPSRRRELRLVVDRRIKLACHSPQEPDRGLTAGVVQTLAATTRLAV
jgi:hypothetical protein